MYRENLKGVIKIIGVMKIIWHKWSMGDPLPKLFKMD